MIIIFADQNFLRRYRSNALTAQTGPAGENIPRHTDVLINEKYA